MYIWYTQVGDLSLEQLVRALVVVSLLQGVQRILVYVGLVGELQDSLFSTTVGGKGVKVYRRM